MIVGNGSIAHEFNQSDIDHSNCVIFASGVSNSKETDVKQFRREAELINSVLEKCKNKKFIYFTSVLSDMGNSNKYYDHKARMERMIYRRTNNYIIYRIPQVISWAGNKTNIVNYLNTKILAGHKITVQGGVRRALLSVSDLVSIVDYSKDKIKKGYVNVSYIEKMTVLDLTELIGRRINIRPDIEIIDGNDNNNWYFENSEIVLEWIYNNNIQMKGYNKKVVEKYI